MELIYAFALNSGNYVTAMLFVVVAFVGVWMLRTVRSLLAKTCLINCLPSVQKSKQVKDLSFGSPYSGTDLNPDAFMFRHLLHQAPDLFNNSREAYESALRKHGHVIAVKRKGKVGAPASAYLPSVAKLFSTSSSISLTIP